MSKLFVDQAFVVVPESVLTAEISAQAFRLWCVLATFGKTSGAAFPRVGTVAKKMNVSAPTVKRASRELAKIGLLKKVQKVAPSGRFSSNDWILSAEPSPGITDDPPGITDDPRFARAGEPGRSLESYPDPTSYRDEAAPWPTVDGAGAAAALYIDTLTARGVTQIPQSRVVRIGNEAKKLLQEGIDQVLVEAAIKVVAQRSLSPSLLGTIVMDVQAPRQNENQKRFGRGVTAKEIFDDVRSQLDRNGSSLSNGLASLSLPSGSAGD